MKILATLILATALLAAPALGDPAWGRSAERDHVAAQYAANSGDVLPLRSILPNVRAKVPGSILDADLTGDANRPIYTIRILGEDGNVRVVRVDARNGRILQIWQ